MLQILPPAEPLEWSSREGSFEKAIQEFNEAIVRDPRNSVSIGDLATTLIITRQFAAAENVYDRLIALAPDEPMLKVQKAFNVAFMQRGNRTEFQSAVAALPVSMAEDRALLSLRLNFALYDRNWLGAKEVIQEMKDGEDNGYFAYASLPVPYPLANASEIHSWSADASSRFARDRVLPTAIRPRNPGILAATPSAGPRSVNSASSRANLS